MCHLIPTDRAARIEWRNESSQKPPKQAVYLNETGAAEILKNAHAHIASVWNGDFHNAKQVLAAMKKRVRKPVSNKAADIQTAFHIYRMQQAQQSRVLNMLAVEIGVGFTLNLPRAPDVYSALLDVYGEENNRPFLLPLNQLLGFIGAHEWHKKGVYIPALENTVHVPFGVFSPLRGEYLDLISQAPLPPACKTAFDIGTGSGVIAMLLAKRGIADITATDTNPRAIACAQANLQRLGFDRQVCIKAADLFPAGRADLIVCNPPWLPAKPTSAIESALYDPDNTMLKGFLNGVCEHLHENGEVWLVMSDLAEHLHLCAADFLEQCFQTASLEVVEVLKTKPIHSKAVDVNDPLAFARSKETTYLYRLKPIAIEQL
ncbi:MULTISPECIES: class I SAM-dependent methyltransferase [unclassified Neisseria]|uniref:class I SAM-dependent methyltransferase n=1 Tax=unclassified Neisseria TaxID=2623750 RepID=UPI0026664966|nr:MULTISPECIES: class I SAM-dependent methyltransferase [unclassified Neisseria]MDO1509429.1 class I SAM-dependent methyltransferase [Neisseria sp. MVDL19-042950]MDO1515798.1 class I SAM-dependent methyltransferase [Neisseria sp. MVDL18-041461]MDO1563378.1 class I SAM-dependent methyltransferase [Neisseria sp. MVDL20-010259]